MNTYEQVINEAVLALNTGDYKKCINLLNPILDKFPVSTNQGINIRMTLITALSGINRNEESVKICKQLLKSKNTQVREEAKSFIQILNSPNLKIPENWNVEFDNLLSSKEIRSFTIKNSTLNKPHKYIKTSYSPTGETKPLKKGFILLTFILFSLMLFLLSGCVKIENSLDLRESNSINYVLKIHSKYINKMPWQLNFESQLKDISPSKEISIDDEGFSFKKKGLNIKETNFYINKILDIASNTVDINFKDIKIDQLEKNYFLGKRSNIKIRLDLLNLKVSDDLEIFLNIINPSKVKLLSTNSNIKIINKSINWKIIPGKINQIEFSYWSWNQFLIYTLIIVLLIISAYYIRNKRYELGSNLPQLPS